MSFVYDIADLYKCELTVPLAFEMAKANPEHLERAVRYRMRDMFRESRLLERIIPDIRRALGEPKEDEPSALDNDPALPGELWTPSAEQKEARASDEQWGN